MMLFFFSYGKQGLDLPHVDQVLCERYGLGIARDSDSAVHIPARLAILAVRNTNHGSTKLSAKISEEKLTFSGVWPSDNGAWEGLECLG